MTNDLKMHTKPLAKHVSCVLNQHNKGKEDEITWDGFSLSLPQLYPRSMKQKMTLFLKSFAPEGSKNDYCFKKEEVIHMCRTALEVFVLQSDFFDELSINFAKFIY
jgi:hypothetical protein